MRFLADNCLNRGVVTLLKHRGHEVILLTDLIAPDSPDVSVAQLAISNSAILVTQDDDFRSQQSRAKRGDREAFKSVHLLWICELFDGTPRRLAQVIDIVETELSAALERNDRPFLQIYPERVVVYR